MRSALTLTLAFVCATYALAIPARGMFMIIPSLEHELIVL